MQNWKRAAAATAIAVAVTGVAAAAPAQASIVKSAVATCAWGSVGGNGNMSDEPIALHANKAVYTWATVRNNSAGTLHGAFFDYQIQAPSERETAAPNIWWHVQGDPWHHLVFRWYPQVKNGSDAFWDTADAVIGDLGPHTSRNLQFSVTYPADAIHGGYDGNLEWGSANCGWNMLGTLPLTTEYL